MRRWLIILALPLVLWSAYWGAGAYTLKQGVAGTLQGQSHGALFTRYSQAQVSGFPTGFQLNLSDFELQQAGMFSWNLPELELQAQSYQPQNIRLEVAGEQTLETAFGALHLTASLLEIGLFLRPTLALPLARAQIEMEGASLTHKDQDWQIGLQQLLMELEALDPVEQDNAQLYPYQLNLDAAALDLSQSGIDLPPSHQIIDRLRADLSLIFSGVWDVSMLEQGPPRLEAVLVRGLAAQAGSSELRMTGQLAQAATGRVFGELVVEVVNWRELLVVLQDAGYVDPDVAELIVEFLGDQYPDELMTLPLEIENGQVRFGVFTLGVLPALP